MATGAGKARVVRVGEGEREMTSVFICLTRSSWGLDAGVTFLGNLATAFEPGGGGIDVQPCLRAVYR